MTALNLAGLIRARKGDRTFQELSDATGGAIGAKHVQIMSQRAIANFPNVKTIEALALALRVPVIDVVLAAARSVGLNIPESGDLVIHGSGELPEASKNAIRDVAYELIRLNRAQGHAGS